MQRLLGLRRLVDARRLATTPSPTHVRIGEVELPLGAHSRGLVPAPPARFVPLLNSQFSLGYIRFLALKDKL